VIESTSCCGSCGAPLAAWEKDHCGCHGPRQLNNAEILYAIACTVGAPLHIRDYVRLADRDYGRRLSAPTATATLAPNPRFCWAGKGLYALYRHGPLPGPRNLEEASRVVLLAAGGPLTTSALDYCLKQLGYRYNVASLNSAVSRSPRITSEQNGQWDHPRGEAAERELRLQIPIVPAGQPAAWMATRDHLVQQVQRALAQRAMLLKDLENPSRFGFDWSED
jgi:hypothetical protein